MKRILICGSNGLLGQRLALMFGHRTEYEVLNTSHHRAFVLDRHLFDYTQLDITSKSDVRSLVGSFRPDVIINAAGMTNVDECEVNREAAWRANVTAVENLVEAGRRVGGAIVQISTDYVFDGKNGPYSETDRVNPINYYGKTKLAGENAVRTGNIRWSILRTIVLYGSGVRVRSNYALAVIARLREGRPMQCATDQVSNPTFVGDLAAAVVRAAERDAEGVYHLCGPLSVSRHQFACDVASVFGLDAGLIQACRLSDLGQRALRPLVTGFVTAKAAAELEYHPLPPIQGLEQMRRESGIPTPNVYRAD